MKTSQELEIERQLIQQLASGESHWSKSQRYKDYKVEVADALNPLSYKKQIKEAYTQLIEEVIEPLRVGR